MASEPGSVGQTAPTDGSNPERDKEEVLRRYQDLVDQKYVRGLTDAEQAEMAQLGQVIDSFFDEFYEPILAELQR